MDKILIKNQSLKDIKDYTPFLTPRHRYTPKTCKKCENKDCINCKALSVEACDKCQLYTFHMRGLCVCCNNFNNIEGCGISFVEPAN